MNKAEIVAGQIAQKLEDLGVEVEISFILERLESVSGHLMNLGSIKLYSFPWCRAAKLDPATLAAALAGGINPGFNPVAVGPCVYCTI